MQLEQLCYLVSCYCLWAYIWFCPYSMLIYVHSAISLPPGGLDWAFQSAPERRTHSSRSLCCLHRVTHDRHLERLASRWCRWQIAGDPSYFPEEPCEWEATHPTTHSHSMCAASCQWCKSETTEASSHINQSLKAYVTESVVHGVEGLG